MKWLNICIHLSKEIVAGLLTVSSFIHLFTCTVEAYAIFLMLQPSLSVAWPRRPCSFGTPKSGDVSSTVSRFPYSLSEVNTQLVCLFSSFKKLETAVHVSSCTTWLETFHIPMVGQWKVPFKTDYWNSNTVTLPSKICFQIHAVLRKTGGEDIRSFCLSLRQLSIKIAIRGFKGDFSLRIYMRPGVLIFHLGNLSLKSNSRVEKLRRCSASIEKRM